MKLAELLNGLEIAEWNADGELDITGICCDSREAKKGDLFLAVKGFESDGHTYIPKAKEGGVSCVICEEVPTVEIPYVRVKNSRRAQAVIAANFYDHPADKMTMIGVTGTNGKTTTTTLVKHMLEEITGEKVGLVGTIRNMIGQEAIHTERTTPDSVELQKLFAKMYTSGCKYVIMEVSSHALALDRVYGVSFAVGLFTNLTRDHLDFHKTMEEYARAKAILFSQSKLGLINLDDEYAETMLELAKCPVKTYSAKNDGADLTARDIRMDREGVSFCALTTGQIEKTRLGIPGTFSVYNGLSALAVTLALGVELSTACEALSHCRGVCGRAEIVPTGRDFTVMIDYSHTPDALENILKATRSFTKGRLVSLFGCGGDRDKTKRPIMGAISEKYADFSIVTSDNPRTEVPGEIIQDILVGMKKVRGTYTVIENRKEAIFWAIQNHKPDDVIVLAGKGHETYQVLGRDKIHFDEREIVQEALKTL